MSKSDLGIMSVQVPRLVWDAR